MRDIEDLGSAFVVKVQDTKNFKSRSFTILGKFYVEICQKSPSLSTSTAFRSSISGLSTKRDTSTLNDICNILFYVMVTRLDCLQSMW
jgi:hypothetical protein